MTIMSSLMPSALVMIGGGIGAALRYNLGRYLMQYNDGHWPIGTFSANIIGGLCMGLLMAFLIRGDMQSDSQMENVRLLIGVGLLGGFTTFSAFSLEMAMMIERGEWMSAIIYALASVLISLLALFAGMIAMRWVL